MLKYAKILSATLLLLLPTAHALVLYNGSNTENQTAPDAAREAIFNSVAKICDSTGNNRSGSAVYIRDKYLLTASHISMRSHVTFDGVIYWERDTNFTPIKFGNADVKLFKLLEDPGLEEIELQTIETGHDISYISGQGKKVVLVDVIGTIVAWGKGTAENGTGFVEGDNQTWTWGNNYAKRWGTNCLDASQWIYSSSNYNYSYVALRTDLDADAGTNEAALAAYDSGAGIFAENDGIWRLAGIATLVQTSGSSTFRPSGNDRNYFVRISSIATAIEAAIPDSSHYADWHIEHSLYDTNTDANVDTDADGIPQLLEFAFGGDPNSNDRSILPTQQLVVAGQDTYLELSVTRPINIQGITYTAQTTSDLNNWPSDAQGIDNAAPTPVDNGDGTETLTYRRSQPLTDTGLAFIRMTVSEL